MTTDVFTRYAALDPAAEPDAHPDWNAVDAVLLATLDDTATAPTTKLEHQHMGPTPQRTGRSAWVAAVAFAVVILAGIAVIIATTNTDSDVVDVPAPPFETPSEAAEAWIRALDEGTAEEIHALLAPEYLGHDGILGPTIAETDWRIRFDRAAGVRWEFRDACESDRNGARATNCEVAMTDPFMGAAFGLEQRVLFVTVKLDTSGYISSASFDDLRRHTYHGPDPLGGLQYDPVAVGDFDREFTAWARREGVDPRDPRYSTSLLDTSPEEAAERYLKTIQQFLDQRSG